MCTWCSQEIDQTPAELAQMRWGGELAPAILVALQKDGRKRRRVAGEGAYDVRRQ